MTSIRENMATTQSLSQVDIQPKMNLAPTSQPSQSSQACGERAQPLRIPHFHELEDIDFSQPPPGTFRFPNDVYENGSRKPYKTLHKRSDILPPNNEPLHKQMLSYAQRWACWAATIEDSERRKEVLDWVTTRMLEAWTFGVKNGDYKLGPFEAAEKERLLKDEKPRKRNNDGPRAMAPFAFDDSGRKQFNIINLELHRAGITMDAIEKQVEKGDLAHGDRLLSIMQERLGRDIIIDDWKPNTGRLTFNAHLHQRNLLMYALWEICQCRQIIQRLELKLLETTNLNQQKSLSNRLDLYRTRSLQHLALAIEIDKKEPVENDDAQSQTEVDATEQDQADSDVEIVKNPDSKTPAGIDQAIGEQSGPEVRSASPATSLQQVNDINHESFFDAALPPLEENLEFDHPANSPIRFDNFDLPEEHVTPNVVAMKRPYSTGDDEQTLAKKQKVQDYSGTFDAFFDINASPQHQSLMEWNSQPTQVYQQPTSAEQQFHMPATASIPPTPTISPISTQQNGFGIQGHEEKKLRYLEEIWQPRIDNLLRAHGHGPLSYTITRWHQVRDNLEKLNIEAPQRNHYFREYQAGLATYIPRTNGSDFYDSTTDRPARHRPSSFILKLPLQQVQNDNDYSDTAINATRGFSFRCLPAANQSQRVRLDELIEEYVTETVADPKTRNKRYGAYVVIHDPAHPDRMAIGHGYWNHRDKSRPAGSEWFYDGDGRPAGFSEPAWHINGFTEPAPATPRNAALPKLRLTNGLRGGQRGERGGGRPSGARGPCRYGSAQTPMFQFRRQQVRYKEEDDDDYDDDGEWLPYAC